MKKLRPNIIDIAIIVVIIAALVGIWARFDLSRRFTSDGVMQPGEISFLILNIMGTSANELQDGTAVYDKTTGNYIGKIDGTSITSTPAEAYIVGDDGIIKKTTTTTGREDVRGVILTEGTHNADGFYYGGNTFVAPGMEIEVNTENLDVTMLVTGVK
jgi:hypothetical protein